MWLLVPFLVLAAGVAGFNISHRLPWNPPPTPPTGRTIPHVKRRAVVAPQPPPAAPEFSPAFLQMAFGDKPPVLEQIRKTLGQPPTQPPAAGTVVPTPAVSPPLAPPRYATHFTVEEARALLPELRRIFAEAQAARSRLEDAAETLRKQAVQIHADPGPAALLRNLGALKCYVEQLENLGVVVESLEPGVVGFPHWRNGTEVLLSWSVDDEDIEYWHPLDGSFASRERR
jgi:hypothetical protein